MPKLGLGLGLPDTRIVSSSVPPPSELPLSTTPIILNFSSDVSGYSTFLSAGNYSLVRTDNSNWRTSGQTQTSPGFYFGLAMTYNSSWPEAYGGFIDGNNKWVLYNGYSDDGSPYFDSLYYHPTHPSTSIPYSGWLLASFYGTQTTGGDLTITAA
jgi:hypothetical protein